MNARDRSQPALDDPRVIEALDEYMAALQNGQKPDRQTFLARHADVADALAQCLDGIEALHEASSASGPPVGGWTAPMDWQPGAPLGDFRIVREVGRGGMGVVYEAEQLSLGRRIALKVLPFALTLDPRQLQRFKNEARAAAQLHHQHIVPVYSVGSERGVHFYAMQFIDGQSLAEVIHQLQQMAANDKALAASAPAPPGPGKETSPPRRESPGPKTEPYPPTVNVAAARTAIAPVGALAMAYSKNGIHFYQSVARLGVQAAEALQHAHEYGVVHRDVKPGNILVDGHGHLWITDFGLAQLQSDGGLTQTGDLLGTLRYMSPEQAGGQRVLLDHRTDVYSLGATLYELLTLQPPFDGADRQTLLRQILEEDPRPPRAIHKSIPVELETIVLKCLDKDAGRRYTSARELADDLSRFLDNQPIRARRATMAHRLRKWARRHPSIFWAVVVMCALTVLGSLFSAEMIRREQQKTQAAYDQEQQRFQLARKAVDGIFTLCEEELANKPHLDGLRRRLLEAALVYYQELIEQGSDDPAAQMELAATRSRVQQILADLAVLQGAGQHPLLKEEAVLDDLRLDEQEREDIREVMAANDRRWHQSFREFIRLPEEQRRQHFLKHVRLTETQVDKILTPGQRRRLRQIALQRQGPRVLEDSEMLAALKLTARQKDQVQLILAEAFPRGRGERPRLGERAKPPEAEADPLKKIVKTVLTPEQRRKWDELMGEPFTGPIPGPPHPPGPRPGHPALRP